VNETAQFKATMRITSSHRDPTGQIYLRKPFVAEELLMVVGAALKTDPS